MAHQNMSSQNHDEGRDPRAQRDASQPEQKKSNRGFASMDPAKQREIASKGGRAAHEKGTAHQFSANEAREAGRKGGGAVSQDRQHMAEIGRIGGQARGRKQRANAQQSEPPARDERDEKDEDGSDKANPSTEYRH